MEINSRFLDALGFTLVDSLWQGLIVLAVAFLGLVVMKKAPARMRHNFLLVCILALPLGGVYSFNQHLILSTEVVDNLMASETIGPNTSELNLFNNEPSTVSQLQMETFWLANKAHWIGLLWMTGLVLVSLRGIGGMLYLKRLKLKATEVQQPEIIRLLKDLSADFGLRTAVLIKESSKVMSPLVSGYFKPIILFPLGLIQGLTTEEVEVILLHELAHLKRNDFLTNIVINGLRAVYFYHPAYWWLQSQLDNEREYATDEMVMSKQSNGLLLVKALAKTQEYKMTTPSLGFAGNSKNQLLKRVNRIMKKQQNPNWLSGAFTMMVLSTAFILMSQSQTKKEVETGDTVKQVRDTTKRISRFTIYPDTPAAVKDSLMGTLGPKVSVSVDFDGPISYYNGGGARQSDSLRFSHDQRTNFGNDSLAAMNFPILSRIMGQSDTTSLALAIQEIIQVPSPIMIESNGNGEVITIKRNGKLLKGDEFNTYQKAVAQLNQYASNTFRSNTESIYKLAELARVSLKENSKEASIEFSKLAQLAGVYFSKDSISTGNYEAIKDRHYVLSVLKQLRLIEAKQRTEMLKKQGEQLNSYLKELKSDSEDESRQKYLKEIVKLRQYMVALNQEELLMKKENDDFLKELDLYRSKQQSGAKLTKYIGRMKELIELKEIKSGSGKSHEMELELRELEMRMKEISSEHNREQQKRFIEESRKIIEAEESFSKARTYDFLENEKSQKEAVLILSRVRRGNKNSIIVLDGKYLPANSLIELNKKMIKSIIVSKGEGLKKYAKRKVKGYDSVIDIKTK